MSNPKGSIYSKPWPELTPQEREQVCRDFFDGESLDDIAYEVAGGQYTVTLEDVREWFESLTDEDFEDDPPEDREPIPEDGHISNIYPESEDESPLDLEDVTDDPQVP